MIQRIYKIKGTEKFFWMNEDGGMSFSIEGDVTDLGHNETKEILSAMKAELDFREIEEEKKLTFMQKLKKFAGK